MASDLKDEGAEPQFLMEKLIAILIKLLKLSSFLSLN
jgi:hypothetical protein